MRKKTACTIPENWGGGGLNLKKFPNRGFEWTYQDRQRGREKLKPYLNRQNLTMKAPDGID